MIFKICQVMHALNLPIFVIKYAQLATLILLAAAAVLMVETDATSGRRGVLIKVTTIDVWSSSISRSQRCSDESQGSWRICDLHKILQQRLRIYVCIYFQCYQLYLFHFKNLNPFFLPLFDLKIKKKFEKLNYHSFLLI